MGDIKINGLNYAYEKYFKDDANLAIERDKADERHKYLEIKNADLNNDGKVTLDEYLEFLQKCCHGQYLISEAQKILAYRLTIHPRLKELINKFGFALLVTFIEKAEKIGAFKNVLFGQEFVNSIAELDYLIHSREDLIYIANKLINIFRRNLYGIPSTLEEVLNRIKPAIKTKEEIEPRVKEFSTFAKHYGGFSPFQTSELMRILPNLKDLFAEFGLAPFVAIARLSGTHTILNFNDPKLKLMVKKYGMDPFIKFSRMKANTGQIYRGLSKLEGFVNSYGMEPFLIIAEKYGARAGLLLEHGLPAVKGLIKSETGLFLYSSWLVEMLKEYNKKGRKYEDPLFSEALPKIKDLINKYGIDIFVRLAKITGEDACDTFIALANHQDLVEKCGIQTFVYLIEKAKKSNEDLFGLLAGGLPAVKHLIKNEKDLTLFWEELCSCSDFVPKNAARDIYLALLNLKHLIQSQEDLRYILQRLISLSREAGAHFGVLRDLIKPDLIKSKSDLKYDAIFYFESAAKNSRNSFLHLCLAELYLTKRKYLAAFNALKNIDAFPPANPQDVVMLKYKVATSILLYAPSNDPAFIQENKMRPLGLVLSICKDILTKYPDSPIAQRALLLTYTFNDPSADLIRETNSRANISILKFKGVKDLSLVFFDGNLAAQVIPGEAKIAGTTIYVAKYFRKYAAIFRKAQETIPDNNDNLLKAHRILPYEFFKGLKSITFTGLNKKMGGEYADREIDIHRGNNSLVSISHELSHHWDWEVPGRKDLSEIYYNISWTPERIKRESGVDCRNDEELKRHRRDFDEDDFANDYAMCDRGEDLASMAEQYVNHGASLRARIREQMEKGKFQLAAKYLFVKHVMPFRGKEYEIKNDSLGLDEVEKKLETWSKEHPRKIRRSALQAIKRIKRIKEKYDGSVF